MGSHRDRSRKQASFNNLFMHTNNRTILAAISKGTPNVIPVRRGIWFCAWWFLRRDVTVSR